MQRHHRSYLSGVLHEGSYSLEALRVSMLYRSRDTLSSLRMVLTPLAIPGVLTPWSHKGWSNQTSEWGYKKHVMEMDWLALTIRV